MVLSRTDLGAMNSIQLIILLYFKIVIIMFANLRDVNENRDKICGENCSKSLFEHSSSM